MVFGTGTVVLSMLYHTDEATTVLCKDGVVAAELRRVVVVEGITGGRVEPA